MVYKEDTFIKDTFIQDNEKDKKDKVRNPVQYYVKFSFTITYILLLTTATITLIEALRTPIPKVRHIFNLETCISLVAGYFYSIFVGKIEDYGKADKIIDWKDITKTRYIDWALTTPLMLMVLSIVLAHNSNKSISAPFIITILILNYGMLFTGYLGENGQMGRITALVTGFALFFLMFGIIFYTFLRGRFISGNYGLYGVYLIIWTIYGIAYMFNEEYKNIVMNILDCIAKCLVGIGLWVYYTKIIDK
jgi:bacteriorhodopsin